MKKIIVTAAAAFCTAITLQGDVTHTVTNASNWPIHVSILYHAGTHTDTAVIEPHASHTFTARAGGIQVKRVDVRRKGQDSPVLEFPLENHGLVPNGTPFAFGSTTWEFRTERGKGIFTKGVLSLISGAKIRPKAGPKGVVACDASRCRNIALWQD